MNLTVTNLDNTTFKSNNKNSKLQKVSVLNNSVKTDKSCDGKFSISEAGKNVVKGIISPVVNLFSSPKNFAIGAGMIAASSAIIAATGGAAAPLFVIAGFGAGAAQVCKAGYKIYKAQNGDDVEKAFYDIGGAATTIGLSAAGSRSSLKQANIKIEGLDKFSAIKKCFTSAKDLTIESFNVFKSGYYKTNLKSAFTVLKHPKRLRRYSKELAIESKENFDSTLNQLREVLPEEFKNSLQGRAKCHVSIYEKIIRNRETLINDIYSTLRDKKLSFSQKVKIIKELKASINKIDTDPKYTKSLVEDVYGARIIEGSPKRLKKIVSSLEKAAKEGKIEILEIENYRGSNQQYYSNTDYYFTDAQLKNLERFCKNQAKVAKRSKNSGYTAVQLKIKPKNGNILELQIRGKEVNAVGDWEHIPYDIRQGKDIAKGNNEVGCKLSKVKKETLRLAQKENGALYDAYQRYVFDNYVYARAKEQGISIKKPELPKGIDSVLSAENLAKMHKITAKADASSVKNPFDLKPQIAVAASTESQV